MLGRLATKPMRASPNHTYEVLVRQLVLVIVLVQKLRRRLSTSVAIELWQRDRETSARAEVLQFDTTVQYSTTVPTGKLLKDTRMHSVWQVRLKQLAVSSGTCEWCEKDLKATTEFTPVRLLDYSERRSSCVRVSITDPHPHECVHAMPISDLILGGAPFLSESYSARRTVSRIRYVLGRRCSQFSLWYGHDTAHRLRR